VRCAGERWVWDVEADARRSVTDGRRIRGLVFGVDADRLIVQATAAEVRRYTAGETVDVQQSIGRDLPSPPVSGVATGARKALCVLRTACGCERRMEMPYPPPPDIRVTLLPSIIVAFSIDDSNTVSTVRTFQRHNRHVETQTVTDTMVQYARSELGDDWVRDPMNRSWIRRTEWFEYREVV
jgi:hypothetical protein